MNVNFDQIYDNENHENIQNSYISNKFQNNNENIEIYVNELPEAKNKKIKISYEDILTSLNMTVVDGKLHYLNNNKNNNNFINQNKLNFNQTRQNNDKSKIQFMNKNNNQNIVINKSNFSNSNYNLQNRSNIQNNNDNVDLNKNIPSVPPGALFNREQYKKFILFQRIKRLQAQQRINKIKSKKMFFSDVKNNNFYSNNKQINNNNFNHLFNFKS